MRKQGGMTTDEVKQLIERGIPGAVATVTDLTGTGDHFKAEVHAAAFADKSMIQQHQLVYRALGSLVGGPIHALQLHTRAP
jgi:stress-induced morphogen